MTIFEMYGRHDIVVSAGKKRLVVSLIVRATCTPVARKLPRVLAVDVTTVAIKRAPKKAKRK